MLTVIELHYKFWKWHNLQRSWNIENFLYREHEIQKGGPQIMTSWYDDVVPGILPIFGDGGDDACSTCHMHACVNTRVVPSPIQIWPSCCFFVPKKQQEGQIWIGLRGSKLSSSNVIRREEVRWSHNVQFCLKSEVSLEHRGRSRSLVSCARNAADEDL